MLHELLFALSGVPGAIFRDKDGNNEVGIVMESLPFIHPSESKQIEELCKLGSCFRRFLNFISKYNINDTSVNRFTNANIGSKATRNGLYIQAFAAGLQKVLERYQEIIVSLEQEILRDPHLPLSYIYNALETYHFVFPTLAGLIETVETKKVHGCQILDLLHENCICGIPDVKDALEKILQVCHSVLYKQLCSWMLYGILLDEYEEFFISTRPALVENAHQEGAEGAEGAKMQLESRVVIRGITGKELDRVKAEEEDPVSSTKDEVQVAFLAPDMLPRYITSRLAEKILFIGQSVKMFKETQRIPLPSSLKKEDILQGREKEFLKSLQMLERETNFSIQHLESEVDRIKSCVAEQLWKLVVEEGELFKHLRSVKEIYLLGRGELFQTFIDQAQNILKAPPSSALSYDLNSSFERSMREVVSDLWHRNIEIVVASKTALQLFSSNVKIKYFVKECIHGDVLEGDECASSLVMNEPCFPMILLESDDYRAFSMNLEIVDTNIERNRQGDEITGWDSIFVTYEAPWPLHLLFTKSMIKRYNVIFRFLFEVKRTQLALQSLWAMQMVGKRSKDDRGLGTTTTWSLRRQMAFFVDNLQYYLQLNAEDETNTCLQLAGSTALPSAVDVLESQFSELLEKIKETHDFESIQMAHDFFITKLLSQCFITMKPVFNTLGELLKVCRMFTELVTLNADRWNDKEQTRTEELGRCFDQHAMLLFKILSSVRSHQVSPHLAQLLLRIDFNKFFSTSTGTTFPYATY